MNFSLKIPFYISAIFVLFCFSCNNGKEKKPNKVIFPAASGAQSKSAGNGLDKSPMDMIYFPPEYPILKMSGKMENDPYVRVIYSRPQLEGRKIFGEILQFGKPWRLGANEATEIEFFRDVRIMNTSIKKGRYIMYAIPYETEWEIRLNNNLYIWGLNVDSSYDIANFTIPATTGERKLEVFSMEFSPNNAGADLVLGWDTLRVSLPIFWTP